MRKKYIDEHLPQYLSGLEKLLKSNNDDWYFVGNNVMNYFFHLFVIHRTQ